MSQVENPSTNSGIWNRLRDRTDVKTALTIALFGVTLTIALNAGFYSSSMVDVFMALALGAAAITLLVLQPSWTNVLAVIAGGLFLAGLDYRVLDFPPKFIAAFSFIGLSSLGVLGMQ